MPPRNWELRIPDILSAINAIQQYTTGMHFADFVSDRKTVDAVVRNLIVIGEAAGQVPEDVVAEHPEIPWSDMRDMRNIIVHEYFGVSDKIVWKTISKNLSPLIPKLLSLLAGSADKDL